MYWQYILKADMAQKTIMVSMENEMRLFVKYIPFHLRNELAMKRNIGRKTLVIRVIL
jgi:hypothetical protein